MIKTHIVSFQCPVQNTNPHPKREEWKHYRENLTKARQNPNTARVMVHTFNPNIRKAKAGMFL